MCTNKPWGHQQCAKLIEFLSDVGRYQELADEWGKKRFWEMIMVRKNRWRHRWEKGVSCECPRHLAVLLEPDPKGSPQLTVVFFWIPLQCFHVGHWNLAQWEYLYHRNRETLTSCPFPRELLVKHLLAHSCPQMFLCATRGLNYQVCHSRRQFGTGWISRSGDNSRTRNERELTFPQLPKIRSSLRSWN